MLNKRISSWQAFVVWVLISLLLFCATVKFFVDGYIISGVFFVFVTLASLLITGRVYYGIGATRKKIDTVTEEDFWKLLDTLERKGIPILTESGKNLEVEVEITPYEESSLSRLGFPATKIE